MLSPELRSALQREAGAAKSPSARGSLVRRWADQFGVSKSTILRIIAASGVKPTRRSTGGRSPEHTLSDNDIESIITHIHLTIRKNGKKIAGVAEAIRMAELRGQIPIGAITVHQVRHWMRKNNLLVRDITAPPPTGQLYSKYAGQVQLFDASVCLQWEFPTTRERMRFLNWKIELGRNKIVEEVARRVGEKRSIIWRIAIVDHFSNLIYVKYYQLAGESAAATVQFLQNAWFPKSNPALIFSGIPEVLIADRGPGNTSQVMANLCRAYGVDLRLHETGHAWAKGAVEQAHNIIETHFECFLAGNPPANVDELNRRAEDWQARFNANQILRRNGMKVDTRNNLWLSSIDGHLRVPGSIAEFQLAASRSAEQISVNVQGLIRYKIAASASGSQSAVRIFRAPDQFAKLFGRGKLWVVFNPFLYRDQQSVYVGSDLNALVPAHEVELRAGGFLKSARPIHHPTQAPVNHQEKFRRRADELALPTAAVDAMDAAELHSITAKFTPVRSQIIRPKLDIAIRVAALDAIAQINDALPGLRPNDRAEIYREVSAIASYTPDEVECLIAKYSDRFSRSARSAAG